MKQYIAIHIDMKYLKVQITAITIRKIVCMYGINIQLKYQKINRGFFLNKIKKQYRF